MNQLEAHQEVETVAVGWNRCGDNSDSSNNSNRTDRSDNSECSDRNDRTDRSDISDSNDRTESSNSNSSNCRNVCDRTVLRDLTALTEVTEVKVLTGQDISQGKSLHRSERSENSKFPTTTADFQESDLTWAAFSPGLSPEV